MEINIKVSDEQIQKLKDFDLGGILDDVMGDMKRFERTGSPLGFFRKPMFPFNRVKLVSKPNFEDKEHPSDEEIRSIEGVARKDLYKEVKELFETKNRRALLKLVLERLSPHSLALLVQK